MMTLPSSAQPRQTLASQLDRFENLLAELHQTLQQAVAAAVEPVMAAALKQAVHQAIQDAVPLLVTALLSNAQLLTALNHSTATAATPETLACARWRGAGQRLAQQSLRDWRQSWTACSIWFAGVFQHRPFLAVAGNRLCRCPRRFLWAFGMGLAMGLLVLWAGPWLGVTVGFLVGVLLALALQQRHRLRPLLTMLLDGE